MSIFKKICALLLIFALFLSTCPTPTNATKKARLKQKSITLEVKKKHVVSLANKIKGATYTFKSNKTRIASVTSKGVIKAKSKGNALITVKQIIRKKGKKVSKKIGTVKVKVNAKKIAAPKLSPTNTPTAITIPTPTIIPTSTIVPTPEVTPTAELAWVGTWGTSVYEAEAGEAVDVSNATLRQVIRISTGGTAFRIHFTNQYGKSPLKIDSVHIAKPVDNFEGIVNPGTIDTLTDTIVTFKDGEEGVVIPAGQTIVSDPITYTAEPLEKIAISIAFASAPTGSQMTSHGGGRHYNFFGEGNAVSEETLNISKATNNANATSWLFINKVDALTSLEDKAIACFGDSITDGYGTDAGYGPYNQKPGKYSRWTDILAQKLQENPLTSNLSVINLGIGGVSVTGTWRAAQIRFERDVLKGDIGYFVFLIGVNDIGKKTSDDGTAEKVIAKYEEMTAKCHENGIKVYGCTLPPFGNNEYYTLFSEEMRQKLNAWIRESAQNGKTDGMIEFDEKMKDPSKEPSQMLATYNGDGLHPSIAGYKFMGEIVFEKFLTSI